MPIAAPQADLLATIVAATKRRPGYAKFDLATPSLNLTMQEAPRTGTNGAGA